MAQLPTDNQARKNIPLATGLFNYFPDALVAVAELSFVANEKHNPGQPVHWSRGKSDDHPDCLLRHFMERGKIDEGWPGGHIRHSTEVAWRALAILQLELEEAKAASMQASVAPPIAASLSMCNHCGALAGTRCMIVGCPGWGWNGVDTP